MRNDVIVEKLIAYTDKILSYCNGLDYDSFSTDSKLVEAPDVPWRLLYGLRNRIVHDYEGVNLQLIWEIIDGDLSPLRDVLKLI